MIDIADMTSPEIKEAIENGYKTAVFAVGSNEQHGPCLTVSTDTILGDVLAYNVAEKLGNALKAPTINVGCSEHHMMFPGTITLRKETLHMVLKDYVTSLARHGFKKIIILPSHGGNFAPLQEVSKELKAIDQNVDVVAYTDLIGFVDYIMATSTDLGVSKEDSGAHAGEAEVSMMMYAKPSSVREELTGDAKGYIGAFDEEATQKIFTHGIAALSPIGVLGDPKQASKEHGERYINDLTDAIVEYINSK
ncbi:MAG: creatininase family protein [Candidatus Bathyarchaeota archaeon]|nr:creatininase family protein [Candidatus Bathyarchaeota archaeon]